MASPWCTHTQCDKSLRVLERPYYRAFLFVMIDNNQWLLSVIPHLFKLQSQVNKKRFKKVKKPLLSFLLQRKINKVWLIDYTCRSTNQIMGDKTFNLTWNNHLANLSGLFEGLYKSGALTDTTLACQGGSLRAHRLVLAACSPFFERVFKEHYGDNPILILKSKILKTLFYWKFKFY